MSETPVAIGMHSNTEIGYRTDQCNYLFSILQDILPRVSSSGDKEDDTTDKNESEAENSMKEIEMKVSEFIDIFSKSDYDDRFPGRR